MIPTFDTWVEIENDKDKDKYIYFLSKWGGSNYIFLEIGEDGFKLSYEFKFPPQNTTFYLLVLLKFKQLTFKFFAFPKYKVLPCQNLPI